MQKMTWPELNRQVQTNKGIARATPEVGKSQSIEIEGTPSSRKRETMD